MEFDTEAATAALEAHFDGGDGGTTSAPEGGFEQAAQPAGVPSGGTTPEQPGQPDSGLFHGVDPNKLSPEQRVMFDQMNKSWTEKTQQLAEQRRAFEQLGSLDEVAQAVQFVRSLEDPSNLVQLHGQLSGYLQSMGLSATEADQAAQGAITDEYGGGYDENAGEFDFQDPRISQLEDQLQQFSDWKNQLEQERLESAIELNLSRQEQAIRAANPSYADADLENIYRLSYAFGGDLQLAQSAYEQQRQAILSGYMNQKGSVQQAATALPATGSAEAPQSMSFEDAHRYAKSVMAGLEGMG